MPVALLELRLSDDEVTGQPLDQYAELLFPLIFEFIREFAKSLFHELNICRKPSEKPF